VVLGKIPNSKSQVLKNIGIEYFLKKILIKEDSDKEFIYNTAIIENKKITELIQ